MSTIESSKIADLLFRRLAGKLNRKQKKELGDWSKASPENELLFNQLTDKVYIHQMMRDFYKSKDAVWKKLLEKVPEFRGMSSERIQEDIRFGRKTGSLIPSSISS